MRVFWLVVLSALISLAGEISIATYNEREKINKLGLEKFKLEEQAKALKGQAGNEQQLAAIKQQLTNVQAEITKTQGEIDRTYGIGSEKGMRFAP